MGWRTNYGDTKNMKNTKNRAIANDAEVSGVTVVAKKKLPITGISYGMVDAEVHIHIDGNPPDDFIEGQQRRAEELCEISCIQAINLATEE